MICNPYQKSIFVCLFVLTVNLSVADDEYQAEISQSVKRSVALIEKSMDEYVKHRECFSCHHQALPILAVTAAQASGYQVDKKKLQAQIDHTLKHFEKNIDKYRQGKGTGGQVDTAGYGLWALAAAKVTKSTSTNAVTEYLVKRDRKRKFWRRSSERPPSEASNFTSTFLAIKALQNYAADEQADNITERINLAKSWVESEKTRDTEDLVFKLNALVALKSDKAKIVKVAERLRKQQRKDGGWAQMPKMASDAYATATVLYSLLKAGEINRKDQSFKNGVRYLLDEQRPDGSWFVKSRSDPFQEYFESGFPHGTDQFIAITATCWAVMVLTDAIEKNISE